MELTRADDGWGYKAVGYDETAAWGGYWSILRPEVILAGEAPEGDIKLPMRFLEWNCVGAAPA